MDVDMYERALSRTRLVVAGTTRDRLDAPTPCDDWDVRTLLNHIIGGCLSYGAGARDEHLDPADVGRDHCAEDHVGAYELAAKRALEGFRTPGALERNLNLPWGETPGRIALGLAISEAAVHGWDLARATAQEAEIDDDIAVAIYEMTAGMMEPRGSYPRGSTFKAPIEVPDDAPIAERAVAYLGRRRS